MEYNSFSRHCPRPRPGLQLDALVAAGVQKRDVFADVTSGSKTAIERPGTKKLLEYAQEGDSIVVWRVDRLGRSLIDVLNTKILLRDRGVHVRSIADGIDPATSRPASAGATALRVNNVPAQYT